MIDTRELKERLNTLLTQYHVTRERAESRRDTLSVSHNLAVTFWQRHDNVTSQLKDLEEGLAGQDTVALDPHVLHEQLKSVHVRGLALYLFFLYTATSWVYLPLLRGADRNLVSLSPGRRAD